jgi:hypothetical protein
MREGRSNSFEHLRHLRHVHRIPHLVV